MLYQCLHGVRNCNSRFEEFVVLTVEDDESDAGQRARQHDERHAQEAVLARDRRVTAEPVLVLLRCRVT